MYWLQKQTTTKTENFRHNQHFLQITSTQDVLHTDSDDKWMSQHQDTSLMLLHSDQKSLQSPRLKSLLSHFLCFYEARKYAYVLNVSCLISCAFTEREKKSLCIICLLSHLWSFYIARNKSLHLKRLLSRLLCFLKRLLSHLLCFYRARKKFPMS